MKASYHSYTLRTAHYNYGPSPSRFTGDVITFGIEAVLRLMTLRLRIVRPLTGLVVMGCPL